MKSLVFTAVSTYVAIIFFIFQMAISYQYEASCTSCNTSIISRADPEGDMGSVPALKDQKMIGFPSNTGTDPMK